IDASGDAKVLVTARTLRARRDHPDWFGAAGAYEPLPVDGPAAKHLVAFARGGSAVTLAPRLVAGVARIGWGETVVHLPAGLWRNVFTGALESGGERRVAELLAAFPLALLIAEAAS
ncbi:MAG: (1-_4)-alpha-D-glucan 1-alpha-D-glucosylmutase, partial [Frankiaceae bacterium]|nr:(1->4)-alpha-D-glucan 1-alpha-D-glucosylmutase [Frankiaceae bacterium]